MFVPFCVMMCVCVRGFLFLFDRTTCGCRLQSGESHAHIQHYTRYTSLQWHLAWVCVNYGNWFAHKMASNPTDSIGNEHTRTSSARQINTKIIRRRTRKYECKLRQIERMLAMKKLPHATRQHSEVVVGLTREWRKFYCRRKATE